MTFEPNEIYVDLGGSDVPCVLDSHGAPFCGDLSILAGGVSVGTQEFPLSFEQFRSHVQHRLIANNLKSRTYIIKGSITTNINYGDSGESTGVFNVIIPTNDVSEYTVTFKNWIHDESYKMNLSVTTSASVYDNHHPTLVFINTGGINLNIFGMDLQSGSFTDKYDTYDIGTIAFNNNVSTSQNTYDRHNYINKLRLVNCRVFSHGGGVVTNNNTDMIDVSHIFKHYSSVELINSILYSTTITNTVAYIDYPINTNMYGDWDCYYDIVGSILLNITNIFRLGNFNSLNIDYSNFIRSSVFSGDVQGYLDSTIYTNCKNVITTNTDCQFGFNVPSLTYNIMSMTDSDYLYIDNGWETIDVYGYRTTPYSDYVYGRRDGVGALYFPELPSPKVFSGYKVVNIGDVVSLENSYVDYYTTFHPSGYIWNIDGVEYPNSETDARIGYTINRYGIIPITLEAKSHNEWYSAYSSPYYMKSIPENQYSDIQILTYNDLGVETSTFTVNENVNVKIIIPNPNIKTVKLYSDMDSNINIVNRVEYNSYVAISATAKTEYNTIGTHILKCESETTYNDFAYVSKVLNIIDVQSKTYFVDLSVDYDTNKQFSKKYVIWDDFEDQLINNAININFISSYYVRKMYDEYVATCNDTVGNKYLCKGLMFDNLSAECVIVRENETDVPSFGIEFDNKKYEVSWKFIDNAIKISGDVNYKLSYGKFPKDLSCPKALHKIGIRWVLNADTKVLTLYYSLDLKTWNKSVSIGIVYSVNTISVYTNNTSHTGLGSILIQADSVNTNDFGQGLIYGSEQYPLSYADFYNKIKVSGDGEFGDIYKCRSWRQIPIAPIFEIDSSKQFSIDAWDNRKYGPWMVRFVGTANFTGATLSNGIIYNKPFMSQPSNLYISFTYNMFITWNDPHSINTKIILVRMPSRYTGVDKRVDIIGSTIYSKSGFITYEGD